MHLQMQMRRESDRHCPDLGLSLVLACRRHDQVVSTMPRSTIRRLRLDQCASRAVGFGDDFLAVGNYDE
jgi:hypothetical protein